MWNKREFGDMGMKEKGLLSELQMLDEKEGRHGLSQEERNRKEELRTEVE